MAGGYLCKMLNNVKCGVTIPPTHKLCLLQSHPPLLVSLRYISSTSNQHSFTVSYLINSGGFSPETALTISKKVNFKTSEKPYSVINFFKNHGFSQTQISKLLKKFPQVLASNPGKTLLPKLEFFHSQGFSSPDLAQVLSASPSILKRSLENHIIPTFNFLKSLMRSNEKTITAIKRFSCVLSINLESYVIPSISILQDNGVSESNIAKLFHSQPRTFLVNSEVLKKIVEEVKKMGFNPLSSRFGTAVFVMRALSKSTWERKVDVYKRWGWSEEEILAAFRKSPLCMVYSEDKIMAVMEFFVSSMGLESLFIARRPLLLSLSLEKRIIPRAAVIQFLFSKGLVKKSTGWCKPFEYCEKMFLQKFVNSYKQEAPELLKLYKEKLDGYTKF